MNDTINTDANVHAVLKHTTQRWSLAPLCWLLALVFAVGGPIYLLSRGGMLAQAGMGLLAVEAGVLGMLMKLLITTFSNSADEFEKRGDNSQIHISNDLKYLAVQINSLSSGF